MNQRNKKDAVSRSPFMILGVVMTLFYFGIGLFLLFNKTALPAIPSEFRSVFASMLLMYGAFRAWKVYNIYFRTGDA